jgi:hypothetical protein
MTPAIGREGSDRHRQSWFAPIVEARIGLGDATIGGKIACDSGCDALPTIFDELNAPESAVSADNSGPGFRVQAGASYSKGPRRMDASAQRIVRDLGDDLIVKSQSGPRLRAI